MLSRRARCTQTNAQIPQTIRPSRVKPQSRLVVPTRRTRRNTNTEPLWLSLIKRPQISHLFQKPDECPPQPPVRQSSSDRTASFQLSLPHNSNSTSCLSVRAARTQQVTLSLSQTAVLCEVCRNAAPPKSWQLPQKQ